MIYLRHAKKLYIVCMHILSSRARERCSECKRAALQSSNVVHRYTKRKTYPNTQAKKANLNTAKITSATGRS